MADRLRHVRGDRPEALSNWKGRILQSGIIRLARKARGLGGKGRRDREWFPLAFSVWSPILGALDCAPPFIVAKARKL